MAAAFLRKLGVQDEAMEDACQEVFLQLFRYLQPWRPCTAMRHVSRVGALQAEAQLSRIGLLARLGHTQEALTESGRLLSGASGRERSADLHLLRGDLMRERLGDCDGAIKEYALAEADRGVSGTEAALGTLAASRTKAESM